MLVVVNGAYKSGSSWLYTIVRELRRGRRIPEPYQNSLWRHSSLHPKRVATFLDEVHYHRRDYLAKNHLARPKHRALLADRRGVLVLSITRDLRDTLVSAYHHDRGPDAPPEEFARFFRSRGRRILKGLLRHHALCNEPAGNIYVSSYRRLKDDFREEVRCIARFLGVEPSDEEIDRVADVTHIDRKRQALTTDSTRGGQYLHRKCVTGDHVNYFNEALHARFQKLVRGGQYE